jgi:hypothetical protein
VTKVKLRLLAALGAFAAGVGAVVTVALLANSTLGGSSSSGSVAPPAVPPAPTASGTDAAAFPSPPPGALVLAGEDRDLAVGLAVTRRGSRLGLQASVLGQDQPAPGLSVSFRLPGAGPVQARSCGTGCYRAVVDGAAARRVEVAIRGHDRPASAVTFTLPASVPGPPAAGLVRRAAATWRSLRTLVDHDRLSSGPGATIDTVWQFQAPYRLTYRIRNGPQAVAIGGRRWDKVVGGGWQESTQDPIRQPIPLWQSVSDAHLLGSAIVRGKPTSEIGFFDPRIPAWFTIWVEKATMRTLQLTMTAKAHFMHEVYGPFDSRLRIVPPRKGGA